MNNMEQIVQLALQAFDKSSMDTHDRNYFELHFRRLLMQSFNKPLTTSQTYVGTPGVTINKTGTSTTRDCPPSTSTGTILHG